MISQLPTWIWVGAPTLALVAGMVNVLGYLGLEQQAVAHLTGTTSLLGAAVVQGDGRQSRDLLLVVAAFVGGAVLSGAIVRDRALELGRRYGVALAIEAALLAASVPLFEQQRIAGAALAAGACGLQNAMTATYTGALARTSHLTGTFTDLGALIGHFLRGIRVDTRRLWLCLAIIGGFLLGGVLGAGLFPHWGYHTLYVPAFMTGSTGMTYLAWRFCRNGAATPPN